MFGMSAGTVLSAVAPAVIGGLMGGSSGGNSATQSTQNQLDPNLMPYLYGQGGLLGGVNGLYQQQAAQGGLNPMQLSGLEMQRQTLMNPAFTQGFDQMRSLGSGLMSQGVAGNPFTGGRAAMPQMPSLMGGMGGMGSMGGLMGGDQRRGFGPNPDRMNALGSALGFGGAYDPLAAANRPVQQALPAPSMPAPVAPAQSPAMSAPRFGGWGGEVDPNWRNAG